MRLKQLWIVLLLSLFGPACAREQAYRPVPLPPVRHVVLISIDSLRPDHLGVYGYKRPTSPRLDAFAQDAIRFDRAYSSANWTLPAHAGMLTGRMSSAHGAILLGSVVRAEMPFVSETLQANGFATAAFTTHSFLSQTHGMSRGFDTFDYEQESPAPKVTGKAIDWLNRQPAEKPTFLFLHYFDVHYPYGRPDAPVEQFAKPDCRGPVNVGQLLTAGLQQDWKKFECYKDLYDSGIALVDRELGRLFDAMKQSGRYDDTLIVVTADHGELLGKGEGATHGISMQEAEIRVPLLLKWPQSAGKNTTVAQVVDTIQLPATILEAVGLNSFPTDLPSLQPLLAGKPGVPWVGCETGNMGYQEIAVIRGDDKLILPPPYRIIDMKMTPKLVNIKKGEALDLWAKNPEVVADLLALAEKSGWYGRGTAYEIDYSLTKSARPLFLHAELPPGAKVVQVRPINRQFELSGGRLVQVAEAFKQQADGIDIRLDPTKKAEGFLIIVEKPDPALRFDVEGNESRGAVKLLAGPDREAWSDSPFEFEAFEDRWQPAEPPAGDYVWIRAYPVLHLNRPGAGLSAEAAVMTPEQQRVLRSLGYLSM